MTTPATPKRYDRAYFDRWYRHGGIGGARRLARKVALAVATAEYHLERPVRTGRSRWYSAVATASATLRASRRAPPMPPRRYQRSK